MTGPPELISAMIKQYLIVKEVVDKGGQSLCTYMNFCHVTVAPLISCQWEQTNTCPMRFVHLPGFY